MSDTALRNKKTHCNTSGSSVVGDDLSLDVSGERDDVSLPQSASEQVERFGWFEDPGLDFPFYNGRPVGLTGLQWTFLMIATVLGFLALTVPLPIYAGKIGAFLPAILFVGIPLAGLALLTPRYWNTLFHKINGRSIGWMFGFAMLNFGVTLGVATVVKMFRETNSNAAIGMLETMSDSDRGLFFLKTIPQLLGEEVMTILPFLALLTLFSKRLKMSRKWAIAGAWLISAVIFGLMHLPTYGWNFVQCLVIIGTARLMLSLAYIKTKNIWVSAGAHIINDWTIFLLTILGASLHAA